MTLISKIQHVEIYKNEQYNTFPTIVKLADDTFRLSFRQAPDRQAIYGSITHMDVSAKGVSIGSADGLVWDTQTATIWDDYFHGLQDPCLNVLRDGTLFATYFTYKVYEKEDAPAPADRSGFWTDLVYDRWMGELMGAYSIRSTDGGITWDKPVLMGLGHCGIRGNCVEMEDGAILAPLYEVDGDINNVVVGRTVDCGQTWETHAFIPGYEGQYHFQEPNLYKTESGKLILFIRSRKLQIQTGEEHLATPLFTSESTDGGRTWSEAKLWPIYSPSPFNLLRLADGRVLLNYGYRHKPFGIRAFILDAECTNMGIAEEFVIRDDGLGGDIGYTSAVQLADGRVLITYYYYHSDGIRYIAGSICTLEKSV